MGREGGQDDDDDGMMMMMTMVMKDDDDDALFNEIALLELNTQLLAFILMTLWQYTPNSYV